MTEQDTLHDSPAVASSVFEELQARPPCRRWTADGLRQALDELYVRYSHPVIGYLGDGWIADVDSTVFEELAPRCYLAAAVACALHTSSAIPAVACGAWAETGVLAHLEAAPPPHLLERDLFSDPPTPQPDQATALRSQAPMFMVAELPDRDWQAALEANPLLVNPRMEESADGLATVRAGVHPPGAHAGSAGLSGGIPGDKATECIVELCASPLLKGLGRALDLIERDTGAQVSPGRPLGSLVDLHGMPSPELARIVPDLPAWALDEGAFGLTAAETLARWLALAPRPPAPRTIGVLRARAGLAHHIAALTACWPAIGWAGLLTGAGDIRAAMMAAHRAGIRILPPTVQSGETAWEHDAGAPTPTVRPPLRLVIGLDSELEHIAVALRRNGPFTSVGDFVRRVPAMAANPDVLRGLLDAGALDRLCDRALISAHWCIVSAWCADAGTVGASEPSVDGFSLFAVPAEGEVAMMDVGGWWDRFGRVGTWLLAPDTVFTPVSGSTELAGATVQGSRPWHGDGEDLTVLAVSAGDRLLHAVIAAPKDGGNGRRSITVQTPTPGDESTGPVWIETALVAAPRGRIEVLVPLLGDRDRDLERLRRVEATLVQHKGECQVRVILARADLRRVVERPNASGVTWSAAFVDALEALLGPNCARLIYASQPAGTPGPLNPATPLL